MKVCTMMDSTSPHPTKSWKFEFLQIQDGGRQPFWKKN